jgi:uncharacterized protein
MASASSVAVGQRPLITFFALAIALGWIVALPLVLSPAGLGVIPLRLPETWLMLVATTPTIAALWTRWRMAGDLRICRVRAPWKALLGGAFLGMALVLLALAVVPAILIGNGAVGALHWSAILTASAPWWSNPLNLLGGPLNEEPGWRGFALPGLQERFGPLAGSLILGIAWTVWHAPLFLVQGWLSVPIWAFVALMICMSILMTWGTNVARGSIVPAVLMHAVYNSSFPIVVGLCRGLPTRTPGLVWYVVGVVLTTMGVVAVTRTRLGRPATP